MNQPQATPHASARDTLENLKQRFPRTPFLALGQTALWDEPTKAALRRLLDTVWPEARMIAGAHDTDYFAKLPGHPSSAEHGSFALVLHDDARTRGLWSAAGEMSQLFGSEDVVTREMLRDTAGVTLHRALSQATDPDFLLSELTAAWGWTGIIYTEWDRKIARDIPLADILPVLMDQMDGAMQGSADCLDGQRAEAARALAERIKGWVTAYARAVPDASLTDLYESLLPRFYELLLGGPAWNLSTTRTTELLRFNTANAMRPRFAFLDLFLRPETRKSAEDSYNLAVAGSDIYTLDQFGEGALPFDVVVPGKGRGTLRIPNDRTVAIDTPREPITLKADESITGVAALSRLLERRLGRDVTLVGKAVTLLPMLGAEHILVFHEGASSYTNRTRDLVSEMKRRGLPVPPLAPILRIRYATWDSLSVVTPQDENDQIQLPEHLCQAFKRNSLSFEEFGSCWGYARNRSKSLLDELSPLRSPRQLLTHFAKTLGVEWQAKVEAFEKATIMLLDTRDRAAVLKGRQLTLLDEVYKRRRENVELEQRKGDAFRAEVQPLRDRLLDASEGDAPTLEAEIARLEAARSATYDPAIAANREFIQDARQTVRELKAERFAVERGPEAEEARATLRRLAGEAETEKARLSGNALRAVHGLTHTDNRPSAWWFPLVDPSGSWFRQLADTAELYLEPLDAQS